MSAGKGFFRVNACCFVGLILTLALLLSLSACGPPAADQETRKEIQALKAEVAGLKEQVSKLEAGQQAIQAQLKKPTGAVVIPAPKPQAAAPEAQKALTVAQLLETPDRYVGTRVTVKGAVGTVLMHHKSFTMNSPQGMVEVFFGKLPDPRQVARLTSSNIDQPVTVTGMVSQPPKGSAMKLQINAESVEF